MGTINYGTSQFITIGAPDYNGDAEAYDLLEDWVREKLNQYNFEYYDLDIEYGYYEGFYINIQKNDSFYFLDVSDAKETAPIIRNEIDGVCAALRELCELGCCVVHPGWATAYLNLEDSIKEIEFAKYVMAADLLEEVEYVVRCNQRKA